MKTLGFEGSFWETPGLCTKEGGGLLIGGLFIGPLFIPHNTSIHAILSD